jgi:glyoxylase-like metal-dependent hydrolase (beta-lactamase superfamily II)
MIFRPFYDFGSGCAAYLFGCGSLGKCAVVDPQEGDVRTYAAFAESKKMRITHAIDTHLHADHPSGGRALAELVGARYCLHRSAPVSFEFEPLDEGTMIELGNVRVRVIHTPGHSPESICLLVTDLRRGSEPWFVLTGDTLFSGAVGRPDLPGHARESALQLYDSLHDKLLTLPDSLEAYPAHFAGSACGVGLSGKPSTTLAFEKRFNAMLTLDKEAFVESVSVVPPKPANMDAILARNQGKA